MTIPINRIAAALKKRNKHVSLIRQIALSRKPSNFWRDTFEQHQSFLGRDLRGVRRYQHKRRTPKSKRCAGRLRPR